MPTTPRGYPYPSNSDRVDIPGDMQEALAAVDSDVGAHVGDTSVHHALGTGATQAAPGNHTHGAGDVSGLGPRVVAWGTVTVTIPAGQSWAQADFNAGQWHTSGRLFCQALGGRDVYAIIDPTKPGPPDQFRITVWSSDPRPANEVRYVNWMLVM